MSTEREGLAAEIEAWCEMFHDAYEAAAVEAGWETQERSRKPWADVPEANRATMRATIRAVLTSDLLAARDRRVRAEALREAAEAWPREVNAETIRREIATFDLRETPAEYRVDQWLRDRADRIEADQ